MKGLQRTTTRHQLLVILSALAASVICWFDERALSTSNECKWISLIASAASDLLLRIFPPLDGVGVSRRRGASHGLRARRRAHGPGGASTPRTPSSDRDLDLHGGTHTHTHARSAGICRSGNGAAAAAMAWRYDARLARPRADQGRIRPGRPTTRGPRRLRLQPSPGLIIETPSGMGSDTGLSYRCVNIVWCGW